MTHNLEVSDFTRINPELLEEETYQQFRTYRIDDKTTTNLCRFLFYIELEMYYDKPLRDGMYSLQNLNPYKNKYDNPSVYIGDNSRADYSYEKSRAGDEPYLYHILIDVNSIYFEKAMANIRKSSFYKDEYFYKDLSTNKIVVRVYAFSKERINKCIRGDFGDLFKESDYKALKNPSIFYTYFNINFKKKTVTFKEESAILLGAKTLPRQQTEADKLIEKLGIVENDLKELLYQRHGYPEAEILN